MRRHLIAFILILLLTFSLYGAGCTEFLASSADNPEEDVEDDPDPDSPDEAEAEPKPEPKPEPEPEPEPEPDIRSIVVASAGDITAHQPQIRGARDAEGQYDFSPTFEAIAPHLKRADLVVGDLETSQAGPEISFLGYQGYTGYPCFNAPDAFSRALREAGFDIVSTANNHSLDRGLQGLKQTLETVRETGMQTFGTYMDEEEQRTPLIVEVDGIELAFLSWTFSTNAIPVPEGHEYAVNYIHYFDTVDPILVDIERAREAGADMVIVAMHWGEMYVTDPPPHYREVAEQLAEGGADLILGGHPHVVQPMEWFFTEEEDGSRRPTLVTYSMGNFLSNQNYPSNPTELVEYGNLIYFEITKDMDTGETAISDVDFEVTWVQRDHRHRILPLSEVLDEDPSRFELGEGLIERLSAGREKVMEIIGRYGYFEESPLED